MGYGEIGGCRLSCGKWNVASQGDMWTCFIYFFLNRKISKSWKGRGQAVGGDWTSHGRKENARRETVEIAVATGSEQPHAAEGNGNWVGWDWIPGPLVDCMFKLELRLLERFNNFKLNRRWIFAKIKRCLVTEDVDCCRKLSPT